MKKNYIAILFSIVLLFTIVSSCKKKDSTTPSSTSNNTVTTNTTTALSINSPFQISYTIGQTAYSKTNGVNSDFNMVYDSGNGYGNPNYIYHGSIGDTTKYVTLNKGSLVSTNGNTPPDSAFLAFFKAGTYSYADTASTGITIDYYDGTKTWSTNKGAKTQSGSSFQIIDSKLFTSITSYTDIKIYAKFNCIVYDGAGNSKTITNGVMITSMENF